MNGPDCIPEPSQYTRDIPNEDRAMQPRSGNERTIWSHKMEEELLLGLNHAKRMGLHVDGAFKLKAWIRVAGRVQRATTNMQWITLKICEDRWKSFRTMWRLWLKHQPKVPDWFWRSNRQGPGSDPEEMDAYFDTHPEMEAFRERGPEHQELLQPLLGHNTILGRYAGGLREAIRDMQSRKRLSRREARLPRNSQAAASN